MKGKWLWVIVFALGFFLAIPGNTAQAQKTARTLSILYSSNINGEFDPCPT